MANHHKYLRSLGMFILGALSIGALHLGGASGCGSSSAAPAPTPSGGVSATTSGGVATINTGNSVVAFVPTGTAVIPVSVEGSGAAALVLTNGTKNTGTTISFIVNSCAADATAFKVVCIGYGDTHVAILDIKSFVANIQAGKVPAAGDITETEFDVPVTSSSSFTGGECTHCGILTDPGNARFIISSADGVRVFNYTSSTATATYSSATGMSLTTENFSFDPVHSLVISPEYSSISGTDERLWVIDLKAGQVCKWSKKMEGASIDATNGLADLDTLGVSTMTADSASIDPNTGIVTIGDEFTNVILMVNLSGFSCKSDGTFDAPELAFKLTNTTSNGLLATGQAIEPVSHLLFLEEEFDKNFGVVSLPGTAPSGAPSVPTYISATMPATTCTGVSWSNAGDPHGLALYTSNTGSKPMGLLIDDSKDCVAVVDLNALAGATRGTGTDSNKVAASVDLVTSGIVKFVPVTP